MKTGQPVDKRLEMFGGAALQLTIGTVLICLGVGVALGIIMESGSYWLWLSVLGLVAAGMTALLTASDRRIVLIKGGLSAVTDTKVITNAEQRQDFRSDFVMTVCLDTSSHYRSTHPPTHRLHLKDRFSQSVLFVETNDGTSILLAQYLPLDKLPLAHIILPGLGIDSPIDQAQRLAIFFGVPLRDLTSTTHATTPSIPLPQSPPVQATSVAITPMPVAPTPIAAPAESMPAATPSTLPIAAAPTPTPQSSSPATAATEQEVEAALNAQLAALEAEHPR